MTQATFDHLHLTLMSQPVLASPIVTCPLIVQTDATSVGLGAVLAQMIGGKEHPIINLSRKLNLAEQKYSTIERDALAVKWAVEALQFYLTNNPFTLMTDYAPFQWLQKVKDGNPWILRWMVLSSPSFLVPDPAPQGELQLDADYLSRLYRGGGIRGHRASPAALIYPVRCGGSGPRSNAQP